MRDYSMEELCVPATYANDPELAVLARRVAVGRWTSELGIGLAEWKQSHLLGEHSAAVKCSVEALRLHERSAQEKTHKAMLASSAFSPPEGCRADVCGEWVYLVGEGLASLSGRLRRLGAEWVPGEARWRLQVSAIESLRKLFGNASRHMSSLKQEQGAEGLRLRTLRLIEWVEIKASQGWVYSNGVETLRTLGVDTDPDLKARLDLALAVAAEKSAADRGQAPHHAAQRAVQSRRRSLRLPRKLYPIRSGPCLDMPTRLESQMVVFTNHTRPFQISDEHPSIYGRHLLPYKGQQGAYFYYRPATSEELASTPDHQKQS